MKLTALAAVAVVLVLAFSPSVGHMASLDLTAKPLTAYRTCVVTGDPSTTTFVLDSSVRQASPTSNFGNSTTNDVASANAANRRLYIRFVLSGCSPSIPASATVKLATLRLYVSTLPGTCRTLDIFRVTASWTETGITWNNQPFGTSINNPASGSRTDSFNVGTPGSCQNRVAGYIAGADVTTDVAEFVAGTATNNGWMLRDDVEGSALTRTTTSSAKNLGTAAQAPQLVITWTR